MGAFDDREQKDAAVKMVGELDAEIVELKAEVATLRAEKDSPHADAKYWRELQEAQTEVRRLGRLVNMSTGELLPAIAERDAALAVVEAVRAVMDRPSDPNGFYLNGFPNQYDALAEGYGDELPNALRSALTKSPADALAEHDRAVRAEALEEAARLIQLQRVLRGRSGEWWAGSDSAEQVVTARAAEYRKAGE